MYRALAADDEEMIRRGISRQISSMNLDIVVQGTAEDGKELLEQYEKLIPDLLLVDINIPHIDGLQCIKQIRETNTTSVIIIISGYDNFEYAQQAIMHGVDFYLLKPVEDHDFYQVMKQAVAKFDDRIERQNIISKSMQKRPRSRQSIVKYIQEHYTDKDLSSEYLEQEFHISHSALFKLIKSQTGKSLNEYITMLRMKHATRLLLSNPEITSHEVALECGYSDQYYFSRVFKKNTGYSPRDYRARNQETGGEGTS